MERKYILNDNKRLNYKRLSYKRLNNKRLNNNRGSITIEAAFIIPVVIMVVVLFITMMRASYIHTKMQMALNEACVDLSYDSFVLKDYGVIDEIHSLNNRHKSESVDISKVVGFKENINVLIENGNNITRVNMLNTEGFIESLSNIFNEFKEITTMIDQVDDTLISEGVYFMNSSFASAYMKQAIPKHIKLSDIPNFEVIDADVFMYGDSGQILIRYEIELPIRLGPFARFDMVNGSYVHAFGGNGDYIQQYNKASSESSYGEQEDVHDHNSEEDIYDNKVYICANGTKYHKSSTCFHINVNYIPATYGQLKDTRSMCKYCGGTSDDIEDYRIVYYTMSGDVMHLDSTCFAIYHQVTALDEKEAILGGYTPCGTCSVIGYVHKEELD